MLLVVLDIPCELNSGGDIAVWILESSKLLLFWQTRQSGNWVILSATNKNFPSSNPRGPSCLYYIHFEKKDETFVVDCRVLGCSWLVFILYSKGFTIWCRVTMTWIFLCDLSYTNNTNHKECSIVFWLHNQKRKFFIHREDIQQSNTPGIVLTTIEILIAWSQNGHLLLLCILIIQYDLMKNHFTVIPWCTE